MNYIEAHITCPESLIEVLIAELDQIGADSIWEEDNMLISVFEESTFQEVDIKELCENYNVEYSIVDSEKKNWNEEWEKNFHPLQIENCSIRASFHEKPENIDYDIIINPKMSFGTGHHETTSLMVEKLLQLDLAGKKILDMGMGTGILAILAEKRGAKDIVAIDIDEWPVENAKENVEINHCKNISIYQGDARLLENFETFDIIIANINRNVLLNDIKVYSSHLATGGQLLLSGFYTEDETLIEKECIKNELRLKDRKNKNNWSIMSFLRN